MWARIKALGEPVCVGERGCFALSKTDAYAC